MSNIESFHDWCLNGLASVDGEIKLTLTFYLKRKTIRLFGATRCLLNNFMIQNIVHDIRIISCDCSGDFSEKASILDKSYPAPSNRDAQELLIITSSVGAEGIIEFSSFEVT